MTRTRGVDAQALHRQSIVIDAEAFLVKSYSGRLKVGGVSALQTTVAHPTEDSLEEIIRCLGEHHVIVRRDDRLQIVENAEQIPRLKAEDRVGVVLALQNTVQLGSNLEMIDALHRLGVRVIQLTYNERNLVGDGCAEPNNQGLSKFGRSLVKRLNELGIVVDLSHVGERSSLEAIEISSRPCMFSHSNPKKLFPNPRNITDEQMKAVADADGIVGICGYAGLCWDGGSRRPTFDDYLRAIDYSVELVGADHVGISTDSPASDPDLIYNYLDLKWYSKTHYPEAVTEYYKNFPELVHDAEWFEDYKGIPDLAKLTERLLERDYPAGDVSKILGGSVLRVYRANFSS